MNRSELVVVGVDGSPPSVAALTWAAREAESLDAPLRAVLVHPEDGREATRQGAERLSRATAALPPEVLTARVSHVVLAGRPAVELVEQARSARLLVLGGHPQRRWTTSVTAHCLREAACPVAVVPPQPEPATATTSAVESPAAPSTPPVQDTAVSAVMSRFVLAVRPDTPLPDALRLMASCAVRHLPVVDEGVCTGLLSEADALWRLTADRSLSGPTATAAQVAQRPLPHVPANSTLGQAASQMRDTDGDGLLVTDGDQVVGILTTADVLALLAHPPAGSAEPGPSTRRRNATRRRTLVVGVDDSPCGLAALRWTLHHAERTGAQVRVVSVCPVSPVLPSSVPLPVTSTDNALDERHHTVLASAVEQAGDVARRVSPDQVVAHGEPGPVLCALAEDAAMLVVGSHGHGRVMSALLGSTSDYSVRHAHCPVVVVPPSASV
ncbi:universal stress protein [Streptoalloteichus hindustanus]|uniref:Nucleotide-binding universal stress protein, UspA family n=1 Tax=Streptoalloteichus hindustanus TaxID=2017 RepID=A0A1M5DUW6_STRHI|nr:universal stress protein [Streptoalloteichus hindustanus]SHF70729.1 Nucleotide-binding universal stress protein, UspA family [Streptoalloteichus hindustanus]